MVSRSIIAGGGRAARAAFAASRAGVAAAQSPAVNPKEADSRARSSRSSRSTQPLNNQPVWKEIRSGAPQVTTVQGRETNVLIQPEGQTWRAMRVPIATAGGWICSCSRCSCCWRVLSLARTDRVARQADGQA